RRDVVVTDGPIGAQAVARVGTKVDGSKAQRDAAPMVGAAAHDARTKPAKIGSRRGGVRLTVNIPGAVGSKELAEVFCLLPGDAHTAMRQVVRPGKHLVVFFG